MFGGRAIHQLLRERLQSKVTVRHLELTYSLFTVCLDLLPQTTENIISNFPLQCSRVFSSLISKKGHEGAESATKSSLRTVALFGAGVSGLLSLATISSCDEAEHGLESPVYPWPHAGILSSYDHSS